MKFMTGKIFSMQKSSLLPSCRMALVALLMASAAASFPGCIYAQEPTDNSSETSDSALPEADVSSEGAEVKDSLPDAEGEKEEQDAFALEDEGLEFEKSAEDLESDFRKKAFDGAMNELLPLNPDEIRTLLERFDRTVESSNLPVHPYPRPETVVNNISLDPGTPPLVVRLAFGYVTTLSILDSTGSPWPIEDMSWVGDFEVMEESEHEYTNMVRISPGSQFAHGNVSMRLVGLDVPRPKHNL
jgi:intracellular multiplication protein IcmK